MKGFPRDQILACIRAKGWTFKRKAKRCELWRLPGDTLRLTISTHKHFSPTETRVVLQQAGYTPAEIEQALTDLVAD